MRHLVCGLGATIALGLLPATPASATTVHPHFFSGSSFETDEYTRRLGINQESGHVIANTIITKLKQFSGSGIPTPFSDPSLGGASIFSLVETKEFGGGDVDIAIDPTSGPTAGNIYVSLESGPVLGFAPSGAPLVGTFPLSGFTRNCGVAVDPQGDVWVSDSGSKELIEFSPGGAPKRRISTFPVQPCRIVIDSQGNIYAGERPGNLGCCSGGPVRKYDSNGVLQYMLDSGEIEQLAIDYSDDDVFVGHGSLGHGQEITQYDSSGHRIDSFGGEEPAHSYPGLGEGYSGLAVNEHTHDVYVSSNRVEGGKTHIEIFHAGEPKVIPTVDALPPGLDLTSATLRGTVDTDGGGDTTECSFRVGA